MKAPRFWLIGPATVLMLAGCSSTPVVLEPVGPAPAKHAVYVPTGRLRVLTATETHEIGDNTYYYPHSGYRIYDPNGKLWKFIPNHIGLMDQSAALVKIPAGRYRIGAESESYGVVTVPVLIEAGKTTVVHLESRWPIPSSASSNQLVFLPNGDPVGWRDSAALVSK